VQPCLDYADDKFHEHLMRCCKSYKDNKRFYTSPYVTIVQSSGFGKSRIVYQVATKIAAPNAKLPESAAFDTRLLYVCARNNKRSTGFPRATPKLAEFFFRDEHMAGRLQVVLEYACANWQAAKTDWLGLFGVDDWATDDATLAQALQEAAEGRKASEPRPSPAKKQRSPSGPVASDGRVKVLVLAIDEAGILLDKTNAAKVSYFRLLQRALAKAQIDDFCGADRHKLQDRGDGAAAVQGHVVAGAECTKYAALSAFREFMLSSRLLSP
jgi:hypothetical protein